MFPIILSILLNYELTAVLVKMVVKKKMEIRELR